MRKKTLIEQKWFNLHIDERIKLFSDYHYSYPNIMAGRRWNKLGKREKEIIKFYIKYK